MREFLDRALHDACRFGIALHQQFFEVLFGDRVGVLVAEGVVAPFAHHVAPFCQQIAERALVGTVANEAVLVLHLDIVAFDNHRGQARRAVRQTCWQSALVGHERVPFGTLTTARSAGGSIGGGCLLATAQPHGPASKKQPFKAAEIG